MLVVCGRRWGLIASVTRLVHLGALPHDLRRRHEACIAVDAAMIAATQPGARASEIFGVCMDAYARQGFEGEWRYHHQGGATGYAGRDWLATPTATVTVVPHQAFAWNPSIAGTKSEDTIVLDDQSRPEFLTATGSWPVLPVTAGDLTLPRPAILELDG
jgi:antitoxin VapB